MTLRPASSGDAAAIAAFLRGHEASSLFPLSNLLGTGPGGQSLWWKPGQGVIALGSSGMMMPQWPRLDPAEVAQALRGQRLTGLIGPADQVDALIPALGLDHALRSSAHEPLCTLDLAAMTPPDLAGLRLVPLRPEDAETVIAFRMDYDAETIAQPQGGAREKAEGDFLRWLAAGSHRLLWRAGVPVALTGFNARLPDVVQVGGVFVPPPLRNRGLARAAVAAHLAEARAAGVARAVLFAANDPAFRAYRALGFAPVGHMGIALLSAPVLL